jgi:hypothetical protein
MRHDGEEEEVSGVGIVGKLDTDKRVTTMFDKASRPRPVASRQ